MKALRTKLISILLSSTLGFVLVIVTRLALNPTSSSGWKEAHFGRDPQLKSPHNSTLRHLNESNRLNKPPRSEQGRFRADGLVVKISLADWMEADPFAFSHALADQTIDAATNLALSQEIINLLDLSPEEVALVDSAVDELLLNMELYNIRSGTFVPVRHAGEGEETFSYKLLGQEVGAEAIRGAFEEKIRRAIGSSKSQVLLPQLSASFETNPIVRGYGRNPVEIYVSPAPEGQDYIMIESVFRNGEKIRGRAFKTPHLPRRYISIFVEELIP